MAQRGRAPLSSPVAFRRPRRARLSAEIFEHLRSAILSGRFKSGDRLPSEKAMAERFQSSRAPVREAVRSLEQAGLLAVRRGFGGGAFVRDGDLRQVTDFLSLLIRLGKVSIEHLTEARLTLEPRIASLAAQRITEPELAQIRRYVDGHRAAIAEGDLHATADLRFHRMVADASKNPALILFANAMADLMVQEVVARLRMDEATNRSNLAFHERIYGALLNRDAEAASRWMHEHVLEVQRRLEHLLGKER